MGHRARARAEAAQVKLSFEAQEGRKKNSENRKTDRNAEKAPAPL
jgi:hypothetical protein